MRDIPAPVAPEQGRALSTTATERSEERRKWRAMVKPMTPAPTTTTSYWWAEEEQETENGVLVEVVLFFQEAREVRVKLRLCRRLGRNAESEVIIVLSELVAETFFNFQKEQIWLMPMNSLLLPLRRVIGLLLVSQLFLVFFYFSFSVITLSFIVIWDSLIFNNIKVFFFPMVIFFIFVICYH